VFPKRIQYAAACVLLLTLVACDRPPHSSPTALRDTNAYFKAMSPPAPPRALNVQALDQVSVTLEGQTLVATYPGNWSSGDESDGFGHSLVRLKPGEKLEGADATFEMVAFAVSGPGLSKAMTNREHFVRLDHFAPDGKPLDADALKKLGLKKWDLEEYDYSSGGGLDYGFPKLKVRLGSVQRRPGHISPVGLFDARTRCAMNSGSGTWQIYSNSLGGVEMRVHAWHATPLELVLDVELDGKVVVETNAIPEMRVTLPGGEVKMLGLWDGSSHSWSSTGGSARDPASMRIDLQRRDKETNALALFVSEPRQLAVHIDLLDGRGRILESSGGGSGSGLRVAGIRGRAEDVKKVRFTVYTNHHRVVLLLPPLPNLPPEYLHVDNLFETRLPQIRINYEYEFQRAIEQATQMKFKYSSWLPSMPTNLFPMLRTNVTPTELLMEYRRHLTNTCTVVVDEQKNEIRVEPTQAEKIKQWLKKKLRF
jgi:hypothetical protein